MPLITIFLDVIIKLNTGYYFEGMLVVEREKIFKNYYKIYLFPDLLGLVGIVSGIIMDELYPHLLVLVRI